MIVTGCRKGWGSRGLGICNVAEFEAPQPSLAQKYNRDTIIEHLSSSRSIANTMLAVRHSYSLVYSLNISINSSVGWKPDSTFPCTNKQSSKVTSASE
jgi:hypothetical protein